MSTPPDDPSALDLALVEASVRLASQAHQATRDQARDHARLLAITSQGVALIQSTSTPDPEGLARIERLLRASLERLAPPGARP